MAYSDCLVEVVVESWIVTQTKSIKINKYYFPTLKRQIIKKVVITCKRACLVGKVTTGDCPWSSFLGNLSITIRKLCSEPNVTTQKPFDWPFPRFSKNLTSMKSETPILVTLSVIS